MEIFKLVVNYPTYEVSNIGNVRNIKRQTILATKQHNGYTLVSIWYKNKRLNVRVHRLVAEAFIENPFDLPYVDHINRIKSDNRAENLRWVTPHMNSKNKKGSHSVHTGVHWSKPLNKWVASIDLGYYDTEEDAMLSYDAASSKLGLKQHEVKGWR
jgi:hypothetical protein